MAARRLCPAWGRAPFLARAMAGRCRKKFVCRGCQMLPEGLPKERGLPFVHGIRCTKRVLDLCTLGSRCTAPWWSRGDLWLLSRAAREERAEPSDTGEQLFAALAEGASGSAFPQLLCAPLLLSGTSELLARGLDQTCAAVPWVGEVAVSAQLGRHTRPRCAPQQCLGSLHMQAGSPGAGPHRRRLLKL